MHKSPQPMKIAVVMDFISYDLAGTEGQVVKLVRGLTERHEVDFILLKSTPWITENADQFGCRVTVLNMGDGIKSLRFIGGVLKLIWHLRQTRPDVVHTVFPIANIVGVLAARLAGVRAILSSRRDYGFWITPGYLKATRFANRFISRIVTNSPEVGRFTTRVEGVPAERISVIFNGVELDKLRRDVPDLALKAQLGIPEGDTVIALVANFRPIKRHDTLLDAVALLVKTHPNVRLLFVGADVPGDAPWQAHIMAHAASLGLTDRIHRGQAKGNINDFLSIVDIGVNSSESEGLSNAVIEYMAAEVAAVVSNGGGNPDLIRHEDNGLVFPVGDAAALSECLRRLIDDAALRQRCVATAFQNAQEMTIGAMVKHSEAAYKVALTPLPKHS